MSDTRNLNPDALGDLVAACECARDMLLNHRDNATAQTCVLMMLDAALRKARGEG